jgi:hypothetical protein
MTTVQEPCEEAAEPDAGWLAGWLMSQHRDHWEISVAPGHRPAFRAERRDIGIIGDRIKSGLTVSHPDARALDAILRAIGTLR